MMPTALSTKNRMATSSLPPALGTIAILKKSVQWNPSVVRSFLHKNTTHSLLPVDGALKTQLFLLRQDACFHRSYAAGGTRYPQADLMLLTHAGCAFKDPRGRFGISDILPCTLFAYSVRADGLKSDALRRTKRARVCTQNQMPFVLRGSQFRTAALRSNRQYGAAAFRTEGPLQKL